MVGQAVGTVGLGPVDRLDTASQTYRFGQLSHMDFMIPAEDVSDQAARVSRQIALIGRKSIKFGLKIGD